MRNKIRPAMLHSSHILNIIMCGEESDDKFRSIAIVDKLLKIEEAAFVAPTHYTTIKLLKRE